MAVGSLTFCIIKIKQSLILYGFFAFNPILSAWFLNASNEIFI